jgi:CheY-like chemotaxis protein
LLRTHLTGIGYPVDIAATGQQGLDYARRHRPRAILLDLILPDTDGWQILREIRADQATHDIPVIITTVVDDHNIGAPLGAVDYLTKPVNPEVLIAILARHAVLPPPGTTATALAIDDDPATLDLITATLAHHGTHTHTAATGSAGLALARQRHYDLIICDLLLPDTDGFAVIAALHTDPANTAIPILVLTGIDLTDSDRHRLAGHVLDIVGKDANTRDRLGDWLNRLHHRTPA